jgi:hypothetical protein
VKRKRRLLEDQRNNGGGGGGEKAQGMGRKSKKIKHFLTRHHILVFIHPYNL